MRKLFAVLALLVAPVIASAQPVTGYVTPIKAQPVSANVNALDASVAMVIKYFPPVGGSSTAITPTVAVAATSLTFTVGGAAYAGFEAPVSGALGGVIDMTDAAADTLGEVVDIINSTPVTFTTGYFRAAIGAGLRSDVMSTLAILADAADTEVGRKDLGEVLYWDSSALDDDNVLFADVNKGASALIGPRNVPQNGAFADSNAVVQYGRANVTNAGTVGDYTVYAVKEFYGSGRGCNSASDCGQGSEEVRVIAVLPAASATEIVTSTAFRDGMLASGEKVFARVDSSGADTSVISMQLSGFVYPKQ